MALKRFCDCCSRDVGSVPHNNVPVPVVDQAGKEHRLVVSMNGADVDVCVYCIIDAFKKLDDRPPVDIDKAVRELVTKYPNPFALYKGPPAPE